MNPAILLFFFSILPLPEVVITAGYDCSPHRCGDVLIEYPFWISGRQPSFCGSPPFEVACRNRTGFPAVPVLKIFNSDYYVNAIFYNNGSFQLTGAEFVVNECPFPIGNRTADVYPFALTPPNKLILFLNCSTSPNLPPPYRRITNCSDVGTLYYVEVLEGSGEPKLPESAAGLCKVLAVPTAVYAQGNYSELLRAGWLLNWTAPDCTPCRESGGQCGYNQSVAKLMCICGGRNYLDSCKSGGIGRKNVIAVIVALVSILALASVLGILLYKDKKRKRLSPSSKFCDDIDNVDGHFQTHIFSYDELLEATDCFHSSRELGDGGFGAVYKGTLRDGRVVAIKRLFDKNYKRVEQFINEVEILSRHRHQNLVSLYGCTSHRSPELLLVYEFVSNGTVADHLHGDRAGERILTWPMRLNIAIETADALAYLHAVDPPIIHRDVKTNNILLDSSFHVKVGDFGLSRLFPANATHVSTTPQGTPGYVDPEYHQHFQLSEKSDVYSYGVVLVELISSKPAIDISRQRSEIKLASLAIAKIQNHELDDLVDRELWGKADETTKRMITMVAELAFRCLQSDADMRPSIKEVLQGLRAIAIGREEDVWNEDEKIELSPDTVAGKWLMSQTTTPNISA